MYKLSTLLALLMISGGLWASDGTELSKTFSDSFDVNSNAQIDIYASSTNLIIETWDQNRVEVQIILEVRAEDAEEARKFLELAKPKISGSAEHVAISNQLNVSKMVTNNNTTKAWFNDGKGKVTIQDYSYRMNVKMPKTNGLDLNARYTQVNLGDLTGPVNIEGVDAEVNAGSLTGSGRLKLSYGNARFGDLSGLNDIKLFEVDFNAGNLGNVELNSRYSQLDLKNVQDVDLKSFEDEIEMETAKNLKGKLSYSELEMKDADRLDLVLFETKVRGGEFHSVDLNAKYSDIQLKSAAELETIDFENQYEIAVVGTFDGEGKYSRYDFDEVTASLRFDGFEDKVRVERLAPTVEKVKMTGKYMNVDLRPDPALTYNLEVDMQYTDLDFPKNLFHPVSISDKNQLRFTATSNKPNPKNVIFMFDCYEGSVELYTP